MIGKTVGRYRIVEKIGEGGMGSVWRAEDPLLSRTIALKFLPEALSSSAESRRRFLREAQAASALEHPGIATVFDAGEVDGRLFIAFRHVDGETVADLIARGQVAIEEACRIATEAGFALQHAHSRGVLHRDVTARNIMLTRDGQVIVVDFGLAVLEGTSRITTKSGATVGTAAYLAPEVLLGKAADQRSDLYGLGVVFYELLAGNSPFESEHAEALYYMAVHEAPKPPSQLRSGVTPEIDAVVAKMLAKDPDARFQSSAEFLSALTGKPIAEVGPHTPSRPLGVNKSASGGRTPKSPPRNLISNVGHRLANRQPLAWFVALSTVALLAATSWYALKLGSGPAFASVAVLGLESAGAEPGENDWLAEGIGQSLATKLTQISKLRVTPWLTSRGILPGGKAFKEIARDLNVDGLIIGTVRQFGNRVYSTISLVDASTGSQYWADEFDEPLTDIFALQNKIAIAAAQSIKGSLTGHEEAELTRPAAQSSEAYKFYIEGSLALQVNSREEHNRALLLFQKAIDIDSTLADAYTGVGAVQSNRFFVGWEGGIKSLEIAKTYYKRALSLNPRSTNALRGLILVADLEGRSEEGLRIGREIQLEGRQDVDAIFVRADAYLLNGQPDRAAPLYEQILSLDPLNQGALWFLVIAYAWSAQPDEALRAGETFIEKFGEDAEVHTWMGSAYQQLGDYESARVHYERAIQLFGENNNVYVMFLAASLYQELGDSARADELIRMTIQDLSAKINAYPDNYRMRASRAYCYGYFRDKNAVKQEENIYFNLTQTDGQIVYLADAEALIGDAGRALELLRSSAREGTDNLFQFPFLLPGGQARLNVHPDYENVMGELKALDDRLRAQY